MHVKKDDMVQIISGAREKDKGKKGKVLKVYPKTERIIVEGINVRKKHMKATNEMQQAGIIDQEGTIHASNVLLYCEKCKKGVRTGTKTLADGSKIRFCRKCGETFNK